MEHREQYRLGLVAVSRFLALIRVTGCADSRHRTVVPKLGRPPRSRFHPWPSPARVEPLDLARTGWQALGRSEFQERAALPGKSPSHLENCRATFPAPTFVAHFYAWEAKTKAGKKSRRRRSPSPNRSRCKSARSSRRPRPSKAAPAAQRSGEPPFTRGTAFPAMGGPFHVCPRRSPSGCWIQSPPRQLFPRMEPPLPEKL